jgi:endonuclease/exonuclease/phosphatase family metal-dependent hydrolase
VKITAATYNIHRCIGLDHRQDHERIRSVLEEMTPDLVALQEVEIRHNHSPNVLAHLTGGTGYQYILGPTMESGKGHYGNALITRHPVRAVRRLDLSFPGREPRGALDVDIRIHDRLIRVLTTHLGLHPLERRQQVKKLLRALTEPTGSPVTILMGDINEWYLWGSPLRWIHKYFGATRNIRTFPANLPIFALDRIWCHPRERLLSLYSHNTRASKTASDHLPLVAEIAL